MCGRFVVNSSAEDLAAQFELAAGALEIHRFNIAPTQEVAVVRADVEQRRSMHLCRWGLVPSWAKDPSIGNRMINARVETVAEKPAFRAAFRRRRCIVPASGFYEWQGKRGSRRPYYFEHDRGALLAIAGLWECWNGPGGEQIESVALITTDADTVVRPVHDRMPVLLSAPAYTTWLDPAVEDVTQLQSLLVSSPPDSLVAHEVDPRVNDARVDDPQCVSPLASLF